MDKIVIKQKLGTENNPMTGLNCEIYVNGNRLTSAISVNFKCDAKGVAKVNLEMIANIEIEGNPEIIKEEVKNEPKES